MRAVNLLPRDEARPRLDARRTPLIVAAGAFVGVTLASFVVGHSASSAASDSRAELATLQSLSGRLPKGQSQNANFGAIAQERNDRVSALSAAIAGRLEFDRLLRQVALVLPENAWLTGFQAAVPAATTSTGGPPAPTPTASDSAEDVTITGATFSQEDVARVLERLALVPALSNVRLASTASVVPSAVGGGASTTKKSGRAVVTFVIAASLRTKGSS
jgi:Tfp pilus assembly protein PilN